MTTIINFFHNEYAVGILFAILASLVGTLAMVYKKKDDDDAISIGEFIYICLRGFLAGFFAINLGFLAFKSYDYSFILAICAGLMRGKFLEDIANFGNTIFSSVFNAVASGITSTLAKPIEVKQEPKIEPVTPPETPKTPSISLPNPQNKEYYSQLNPKWKNKQLPNAEAPSITIGNYGCLLSCISTLFQIEPDKLAEQNADCFQTDGNMLTDKLLSRLNSTMIRTDIIEGQALPTIDKPVIARTSWYSDKSRSGLSISFPTHFYIILPNGSIIDPAKSFPEPNPVNKYKGTTNQIRSLTNTVLM